MSLATPSGRAEAEEGVIRGVVYYDTLAARVQVVLLKDIKQGHSH